jgi:serine protein kinase
MELKEMLVQIREEERQLSWEGTFAEYFEMATKEPRISRLAHARVYDMILEAGTKTGRLGQQEYSLFSNDLFGIEKTIQQVVDYFAAATRRLETRKRILLLMGPPATGKTTLANIIKHGLEEYTRSERGALYAIQDCPIQEEPLHLIPQKYRPEIYEKYGLYIEGDLCPHCRWTLEKIYKGNIDKVQVQRVYISESMGVGIGSFVATDPGSEDISRLVGSVDPGLAGGDRLESFGQAFHLNGELEISNRGLMEFVEIFKLDERFLGMLLVLTEEQKIKAQGYGTIYADEAIIAHSNETEYKNTISHKETEALQDRIMMIKVPYNLRVSEEVRIYQKLLEQVDLRGIHIAPLCLPVASLFAVLSRLEAPQKLGMSLVKKMRLYDGQQVDNYTSKDADEMHEQAPREGMFGISPRFVIDQIARSASKPGVVCLDPIDLLMTMWEGIEQSTSLSQEEQDRLYKLFQDTRREYEEMAKREVQKAFVDEFDRAANKLIKRYIEAIETYLNEQSEHHNGSGQKSEVDEKLMRSLERIINIQDYDAENFRREIQSKTELLKNANLPVNAKLDARLEEAVIRQLCPNDSAIVHILDTPKNLDSEAQTKRNEVIRRLVRERGYEEGCAKKLLDQVAASMDSSRKSKSSLPKALRWLRG